MLITAGVLNRALKKLVSIVPKRSTLPVLGNLKLEPVTGGLAIVATDLTTEACVVVPASDTFAACLPARVLSEFAASIDRDAEGTFSRHGDSVRAAALGATIALPSHPIAEFPKSLEHAARPIEIADPAAFLEGLAWALRAVGADETRPQLTGVLIDGDAIVGCDGHRLHRVVVSGLKCPKALVPGSAIGFALRALRGEAVTISVDKATVRLSSSSWTVTTRQVDAEYPRIEQVIPKHARFEMRVDATTLDAGVRRVCGRRGRLETPIRVQANGAIKLDSLGADVQRATVVDVLASTHRGPDLVTAFNGWYIADALADVDAVATLKFGNALEPLLIEAGARTAVIMPRRL